MTEKYVPRLQKKYNEEIKQNLFKELKYKNIMEVPKIEKIVSNMGVGEAVNNSKLIETAVKELGQIVGQQPLPRAARKSEADSN